VFKKQQIESMYHKTAAPLAANFGVIYYHIDT